MILTQLLLITDPCILNYQLATHPSSITLVNLFRATEWEFQCEFKLHSPSSTAIYNIHSVQPHYRPVRIESSFFGTPINHLPRQLIPCNIMRPSTEIQTSTSVINRDLWTSLSWTLVRFRAKSIIISLRDTHQSSPSSTYYMQLSATFNEISNLPFRHQSWSMILTQFNLITDPCELYHHLMTHPSIISLLNLFFATVCDFQCEIKTQLPKLTTIINTHSAQPHYRSVRIKSATRDIPINHDPCQLFSCNRVWLSMQIQTYAFVINRH